MRPITGEVDKFRLCEVSPPYARGSFYKRKKSIESVSDLPRMYGDRSVSEKKFG